MNEQENVFPEQVPSEPKKSKKKFILGGLVVLIIAAVAVFVAWKFTQGKDGESKETKPKALNNPVEVYQTTVEDGFKLLSDSLKEFESVNFSTAKPMEVALNAKLTTSMTDLAMFNGFEVKTKIGVDLSAKKMNLDLGLNKNGKGLDATIAFLNNHGYLKSANLFSKTLDLGVVEGFDEMFATEIPEIDVKDLEYVIEAYKDVFKNAITDKDCETTKTDNGKIFTYNITGDLAKRLMDSIADKALNDSKLLGILAGYAEVSTSELKSALEELKTEDYSDFEAGKFVIETNDKEVTSGYLEAAGEKPLKFTNNNGEVVITIEDTEAKMVMTINENSAKLSFSDGTTTVEMSATGDEANCSLVVTIKEGSNNMTINADIKNAKTTDNKSSADIALKLKGAVNGQNFDLALDGDYAVEQKALTSFDTTGAVVADNLTEEEITQFSTNLVQVINDLGLSDLVSE